MKVGLSGAVRGKSLVSVLGHFHLFELAAVFDPDDEAAERACRDLGENIERARSFDDLVERSDLVVVASPAAYHVPQSVAALEAGRHVVSEVPACIGIEEAKALKKAQASSGKHFVMAENANYFESALVVKALVREGLFGQVYYAEAEYLHDCRDLSFTPSGEHTWRAHIWKRWVYLTHSLGPALTWFEDEPARVRCLGYGDAAELNEGLEGPAGEVIEVELRRGGLVRIRIDNRSPRPAQHFFLLQGTKGAYESGRGLNGEGAVWFESLHGPSSSGRGGSPVAKWRPLEEFRSRCPELARTPEGAASGGHGTCEYFFWKEQAEAHEAGREPPLGLRESLAISLPASLAVVSRDLGGEWVCVPGLEEL